MIVKMKQVTLLCLEQDKTAVLEKLRDLGVMQLRHAKTPDSKDVAALSGKLSAAQRALLFLSTEEGKARGFCSLSGREAAQRVLDLVAEREELLKEKDSLQRDREALLPWGEFDPASLAALREKALYPYLCITGKNGMEAALLPEDAAVEEISRTKNNRYVLVVARQELDGDAIGAVTLPDNTLSAVDTELQVISDRQNAISAEMLTLKTLLPQVQEYAQSVDGSLEFISARDGMDLADNGKIAWIFGYVPVTGVEALEAMAKEAGAGLMIDDPDPDDEMVPTYIVKSKYLDIMDPLFDFIGVTPGYRENDVNVFFLIFFPLFFGMIIGDAGYGALFIAVTLICKRKFAGKEAARLPLNLFMLLSIVTFIWGWLNGSWFGIPADKLPAVLRGLPFLADPENSPAAHRFAELVGIGDNMGDFKNKFIQFLCFAIAAVHLPGARIFRFFTDLRQTWRCIGHLGWAMVLFANAILAVVLIVYTDLFTLYPVLKTAMTALYIAGVVLIVVSITADAVMTLASNLIGSFVDVLSYIRLFAVALAGALISQKFDEMGANLMGSLPDALQIAGAVLLILVAAFGNILNIGLGFLSVLVHAVRLNTLEFSNHVEMQWAGFKFRPFKKNNKKNS